MQRTLGGDPPLELVLRRLARARRFSLRVSRLDGRVTLSMPAGARESEALAFAESQSDWIRRTLARAVAGCDVGLVRSSPTRGCPLR